MAVPKSGKLLREQAAAADKLSAIIPEDDTTLVYAPGEAIKIKEVPCCNDFVALLQFRVESSIQLDEKSAYKNEGMVVGVGPGLPNGNGGRCPSQLTIGEVVSFYGNPTLTITPNAGAFAGRKIVMVPERSVICKLPPVPFERVDEEKS